MKEYCTQNNGHCETCSLVNYGRDCRNNPLTIKVRGNKTQRTKSCLTTCEAYEYNLLPDEIIEICTAKQLAMICKHIANQKALLKGRAEVADGYVWIGSLQKWFDLAKIKTHCEELQ